MSDVDIRMKERVAEPQAAPPSPDRIAPPVRVRAVPILMTLIMLVLAGVATWALWQAYMAAPWTRDGTVRAYVVTMAPKWPDRSSRCRSPTISLCTRAICLW